MDEVRYETVRACLRAPRFVLAYRRGPDWIYAARRVIQTLSRVWGGAGAVILPADVGGGEAPDLLGLLRAYDPDVIAAHVPLLEDLAQFDTSVVELVMRWHENTGVEDPDAWEHISAQPADSGPWDDVARLADTWCSPLKGHHQDARSLAAHEVVPMARQADSYPDFAVIPRLPGDRVLTLDLSGADPAVALMIESRLGSLDAADRVRVKAIELPVQEADLAHLVRVAITGQIRFSGWDLQARYLSAVGAAASGAPPDGEQIEQYMRDMPFARTCRWLTRVRTVAATPPVVCVVGDTAGDHALAMMCDRLFFSAAWIPLSALKDGPLASAARLGIYELRHVPGAPHRPLLMTSASEPHETVQAIAAEVASAYGFGSAMDPGGWLQAARPGDLARENTRSFLADPRRFMVTRTVPVRRDASGCSLLSPLDMPLPEAAEHLSAGLTWHTDVVLAGQLAPARTALPSSALVQNLTGAIPETVARAGRHGISFSSANMGLVLAGIPVEGRLPRPLLQFPSAEQIFAELAAARHATVERSDAGRRAANAVELWGSFDAIVADLSGPTRRLLDAFLAPPRKRDGDYGDGYAIRGQGYLTFGHATAALGGDPEEVRETLDRLLRLDVLRRGMLLSCERCRWQAFYPIGQVAKAFTCAACNHASNLGQGTWYKGDPEPAWNYSLDQVVRMLLQQHGDIPLLAADHLRQGTRDFLWTPELSIQDAAGSVEIDICFIVNGLVVVGEAKCNGRLDSARKSPEQAASRLIRVAQLLTADEIVLATSERSWAPGATAAVKAALATGWRLGPEPKLAELVNVGR